MRQAIDRATLPRASARRRPLNACIVWEQTPLDRTPSPEWHFMAFQVGHKWGVTVKDILGGSRVQNVVRARHEVWWRMAKEMNLTITRIARRFEVDHTTVSHGIRQHENRIARGMA